MEAVSVLSHAFKHGLNEYEVVWAWKNPLKSRQRSGSNDPPLWIAVGSLPDGRLAELVGFLGADGCWHVFHAKVPPTKKFLRELGMDGGKRHGTH